MALVHSRRQHRRRIGDALASVDERVRALARRALLPLARAYLRYLPFTPLRHRLWNRFVWCPHRFVARTAFGMRMRGHTLDMLQRYVYYFGVWEPHLTAWLNRSISDGDTIIDVGANVGYITLLASERVGPKGRVVAFEASPEIFTSLQENLHLNHVQNVRAVNIAVTDAPGVVTVYHSTADNVGRTNVLRGEEGWGSTTEVGAAPLVDLLTTDEFASARIVKIDVEGAEWLVTRGMIPLLERGRRDLEVVVEVDPHRLAGQGLSAAQLLRLFQTRGFRPYVLENDYQAGAYLHPRPAIPPRRLRTPIDGQLDIVFSRVDAEYL